ncbi:hypothetical protein ACNI65_07690 [Roseateles sp. So40a]|uniref:hypothetical protein n=1 Tax=Roseateles sp. So40a TaxID=3400226 RepID=UPI003A847CCF
MTPRTLHRQAVILNGIASTISLITIYDTAPIRDANIWSFTSIAVMALYFVYVLRVSLPAHIHEERLCWDTDQPFPRLHQILLAKPIILTCVAVLVLFNFPTQYNKIGWIPVVCAMQVGYYGAALFAFRR